MRIDVAVLGANADGLRLAAALARAGSRVAVLEPSMKAGGELLTESFLTSHRYELGGGWVLGDIPTALTAGDSGPGSARPMHPEIPLAWLFDGHPPLCFYRDSEQTLDSLPRRDRRGLARMLQVGERLFDEVQSRLSGPPGPVREPPSHPLFAATVRQALDHYGLRDHRLRCALTSLPLALGHGIELPGSGAALAYLAHGLTRMTVVDGGMGLLAAQLTDEIIRHEGLIFESARVADIFGEGDRVSGIRLADGREITASRFVSTARPTPLDPERPERDGTSAGTGAGIMKLFIDFKRSPEGFAATAPASEDVDRAYMVGFGFEHEDMIYQYLDAITWTQPPTVAGHLINHRLRDTSNPPGALGYLDEPLWCASCHSTDPRELRQRAQTLSRTGGTRAGGIGTNAPGNPDPTSSSSSPQGIRIRPAPASAVWQCVLPHRVRAIDPDAFRLAFEQACIDRICAQLSGVSPADVRFRLTWLPAETSQPLIGAELTRLIAGEAPHPGSTRFANVDLNPARGLARYTGLRTGDALIARITNATR